MCLLVISSSIYAGTISRTVNVSAFLATSTMIPNQRIQVWSIVQKVEGTTEKAPISTISTPTTIPTRTRGSSTASTSALRAGGPPAPFGGGGARTIVFGATAFCVKKSVTVVRQGDCSIVERFGKFHKELDPGLHFLIPFVDQIRATVTIREQVLDIPPQKCITSDNAPLAADAVVYWRIENGVRAIYAVENLKLAIQNLVLTQLRAEIGKLTLDETFSAREKVNQVLLDELDVATEPWGVKITRVEVRDIIPNQEILRAMEMQMAAERTKRASIIKSEGERERSINEAEGSARSRIIDAEASAKSMIVEADAEASKIETEAKGVARALDVIAAAISSSSSSSDGDSDNNNNNTTTTPAIITNAAKADAAKFQLMREYIATQRDLATSNNAKVIVTSSSGIGGGGTAGDMISMDDAFAKAIAYYNVSD